MFGPARDVRALEDGWINAALGKLFDDSHYDGVDDWYSNGGGNRGYLLVDPVYGNGSIAIWHMCVDNHIGAVKKALAQGVACRSLK